MKITYRPLAFLFFAMAALVLGGCQPRATDEIDYGDWHNSVYSNNFFGLRLGVPAEWSVQDQESRQKLIEEGTKAVAGDDRSMTAALKASEQKTVHLVAAFQHPLGSAVTFNPSILCVAERVRDLPGIKTGKDYHFHAQKFMKAGQIPFTFPKPISTEKLAGMDFDVMHVETSVGEMTVKQKYYVAIVKGYALVFIVSFVSPEQEAALQKVLETMVLKPTT